MKQVEAKKEAEAKKQGRAYVKPKEEFEKLEFKRQRKDKVTRVFLRYLIQNRDGNHDFYIQRIMNFAGDKEDSEFWLKQPNVFT